MTNQLTPTTVKLALVTGAAPPASGGLPLSRLLKAATEALS